MYSRDWSTSVFSMTTTAFTFCLPSVKRFPPLPSRSGAAPTWTCAVSNSPNPNTGRKSSTALVAAAAAAVAAASLCISPPFLQVHPADVLAAGVPREVYADALLRATPGTPVADLANVFGRRQEDALAKLLEGIESSSGVKVRVLTQSVGSAPGSAIKEFFGLDEKSVLVVADLRGGNILNFNVGKGVSARLPESFWIELGNRYGSQFYVRDHGDDGAVLAAINDISTCLSSGKVCSAVPGFGRDQYVACATCAVVGGVVAGAAARTGGKQFNIPWFILFSPLWSIFFVSFGLIPVVTREGFASMDTAGLFAGFLVAAGATWGWIPLRFGQSGEEKRTPDI